MRAVENLEGGKILMNFFFVGEMRNSPVGIEITIYALKLNY